MHRNFFYILLFAALLTACSEEDGQGLSLNDLQSEALGEENKYKLTAYVNIFDYVSNTVEVEEDGDYFVVSAFANNEALYVRFPEIAKGNYSSAIDPEIFLYYSDENGRNFFSRNEAFTSNVIVNITSVDTTNRIFYADFSGTLYDIDAENPKNRDNQVSIFGGRINKVSF